jgi:UTP-glucose-1-phosphate uridylyltransferase
VIDAIEMIIVSEDAFLIALPDHVCHWRTVIELMIDERNVWRCNVDFVIEVSVAHA